MFTATNSFSLLKNACLILRFGRSGMIVLVTLLLNFLQVCVMRRDPVRTQVINEILENVHHIWRDVMKGYGVIAAAVRSRLGRVKYVTPIPHVLGYVSGNKMMLRASWW